MDGERWSFRASSDAAHSFMLWRASGHGNRIRSRGWRPLKQQLSDHPPVPGGSPPRPIHLESGLARTTFGVLLMVGLIVASFWILQPFLPAIVWATMIVVATWPLMLRVQAALWNKRAAAVAVMSLVLLLVFVLPFSLALGALIDNADEIVAWAQNLSSTPFPPAPPWLEQLPLVGGAVGRLWAKVAAMDLGQIRSGVAPYAGEISHWLVARIGRVSLILVQFLLTVALAAIMYWKGESTAAGVARFGHRVAGERGTAAVHLAGQAIRGVAMGVVITAFVQAVFSGIGLAICGVPFATMLTAIAFMLCIAQLGPGLVLVPAIIWLYWRGDTGWGTVLLLWSVAAATMDNFLRPVLIKRSADLPLLLIFAGVIGGLVTLGLIGLFIGPVVLAVGFTLLQVWTDEDSPPAAGPSSPRP